MSHNKMSGCIPPGGSERIARASAPEEAVITTAAYRALSAQKLGEHGARVLLIVYHQYAQARNRYLRRRQNCALGMRFAVGFGGQCQGLRLHGDQFALWRQRQCEDKCR